MTTDSLASEIQINVKGALPNFPAVQEAKACGPAGPSELKLQITISTDKTVADLKQAIADKSDVPADRQRLIYSGASASLSIPSPRYSLCPRAGPEGA